MTLQMTSSDRVQIVDHYRLFRVSRGTEDRRVRILAYGDLIDAVLEAVGYDGDLHEATVEWLTEHFVVTIYAGEDVRVYLVTELWDG